MSIRLYILVIVTVFIIGIKGKPPLKGKLSSRINHLLNITGSEKAFNSTLESFINNDPTLSVFKSEVMLFINKFLSFQSLRPHIIKIYRDLYTLSDINGIIKFYSSSLGKKLIENEVKAETRLTQLIKNKLEEQIPQITLWFQQVLNTKLPNDHLNQTIQSVP